MAMFAKRHYEALALVFQDTKPRGDCPDPPAWAQWEDMVKETAGMLARDNPAFDRARFIRACEPGANVKARK